MIWESVSGVQIPGLMSAIEGWMQIFLRKLWPDVEALSFMTIRRTQLGTVPVTKPRPAGHGEKAYQAMLTAAAEGCGLVVFMVDADTTDSRDWERKRDEIQAGFEAARQNLIGIACVPMSASESWLMADDVAWQLMGLRDPAILPQRPETIWGPRDDPAGNHPHRYFKRVCDRANQPDNYTTRREIAERSALETLMRRCPVSFAGFQAELARSVSTSSSGV